MRASREEAFDSSGLELQALVAVTTERVYGQPTSVGFSIATVVVPATHVPGVTFGLFADPEGHVIGVSSND